MKITVKRVLLSIASVSLLPIYGCGGGSSTTPTTSVPITVLDGPIHKAMVCMDINNNGSCDTGEPSALTGTDGKTTLVVDSTLAGKHPVIAVVGTDAIDMDRPDTPIAIPFTLRAPADQTSVITPLTTMVHDIMDSTGVSSAAAETQVKQQAGINISLFEDFTKGTTEDHKAVATVARMVVITIQQQSDLIKDTVDANKVAVPKATLNRAVLKRLREMFPTMVARLQDPLVTGKTGADKEAELLKAANAIIKDEGISKAAAADVIAINEAPPASEGAYVPGAGILLANLSYTDTYNWYMRLFTFSAAQDKPDSAGNTKFTERRIRNSGDATTNAGARWSAGSNPRNQANLHWNGTAWANCPLNFESTSSVRDAKGNSSYNYCDSRESGSSNRVTFDIADKPMIDVYKSIRAAGYTNLSIGGSDNAAATSLLGGGKFPAGSKVHYQTSTAANNAITYYPGTDSVTTQAPAPVAAGNGAACVSNTGANDAPAINLEELVTKNTGTPCIYTAEANTGPRHEGWYATTLGMGKIGTVPTQDVDSRTLTSANYYTGNIKLRAAFGTGNVAKYYRCQERLDGSNRNCDLIGTGTYAIQKMGDGRALTFSGTPALFAALDYTTVYVERAGKVYGSGYQSRPSVSKSARLNTLATTALMTQINPSFAAVAGSPADPDTPLKLTAASYQGVWHLATTFDGTDLGMDLSINANGSANCRWLGSKPGSSTVCSATISQDGSASISESDAGGVPFSTVNLTLDFLKGTGTGSYWDSTTSPSTGDVIVARK